MLMLRAWPLGRRVSALPKEEEKQAIHRTITGGLIDERFKTPVI